MTGQYCRILDILRDPQVPHSKIFKIGQSDQCQTPYECAERFIRSEYSIKINLVINAHFKHAQSKEFLNLSIIFVLAMYCP